MNKLIEEQTDILSSLLKLMIESIDSEYDSCSCQFEYDYGYEDGSSSTGAELSYIHNLEIHSIGIKDMGTIDSLIRELHAIMKRHTGGDWKKFILSLDETEKAHTKFIYEED